MKKLITSVLFLMAALPATVFAADAGGVWKATFETQVGTQNYTYSFTVNGSELTGTISSDNGEVEIQEGSVDGSTITFVELLDYQGMELVITYTGEMTSDNEISFSRDVAGFAVETLTATRE